MIIDKVNGQPVPRYLIYDIIKFNVSISTQECIVSLAYTFFYHWLDIDTGIGPIQGI